eukprot:1612418-Amphidinium_carterae.1
MAKSLQRGPPLQSKVRGKLHPLLVETWKSCGAENNKKSEFAKYQTLGTVKVAENKNPTSPQEFSTSALLRAGVLCLLSWCPCRGVFQREPQTIRIRAQGVSCWTS